MKSNSINYIIMSLLVCSTLVTAAPQEENPALWRKITRFAQRNKGKIIAVGLAVVATALGAVAVKYINEEVEAAIAAAGIKQGTREYTAARYYLTRYGLLGADRGIAALLKDKEATELAALSTNKVGEALANFWNMDQITLATRLGFKGIGSIARKGAQGVKKGAQKVKAKAKETKKKAEDFFNRYF